MKKLLVAFIALCAASLAGASEFKPLFNGKNLDGWVVHGTEKWFVQDDLLVCESGPDKAYGYLTTQEHYKNFILTLEFKPESNGNSGVFIRSSVEGTRVSGWQVEIARTGTGFIYESYGRGWLVKPDPAKNKLLKPKEWNTMKIEVRGDQVVTWLNGHEILDLADAKIGAGEGSIALQIHSGGGVRILWRNILLQPLPDAPVTVAQ